MTSEPIVEQLSDQFGALLEALDAERQALTRHDGAALEACTARKDELCQAIAAALQAAPELAAKIKAADAAAARSGEPADLDPDHKKLLDLAAAARDSNLVNGKILHRSQQSVREILGILSGKSLDGLYEQSGHQSALPEAGSNAIARA